MRYRAELNRTQHSLDVIMRIFLWFYLYLNQNFGWPNMAALN